MRISKQRYSAGYRHSAATEFNNVWVFFLKKIGMGVILPPIPSCFTPPRTLSHSEIVQICKKEIQMFETRYATNVRAHGFSVL